MAASGRYKSRLLNYLVEQSQKLSEQAGHRLRQARTGVVWGAQILIYPLYVAFQTSRVLGRQLSQGGPMPGQARLVPPRPDDVISSVLQLARNLADEGAITLGSHSTSAQASESKTFAMPSPEAFSSASAAAEIGVSGASKTPVALAPSPATTSLKSASPDVAAPILGGVDIRGVASELGNRALVLVDNSNRTVPLESEQQWSLQQTIVQQVADFNYRRQRYGQQLALVEAGEHPLPLPQPRVRQLAGFRWMTHLMGWMQTSDLAQSTNLFKESQLAHQLSAQVAAPPFLYWDPEPGQQLTRQTLAQLDSPLAGLEQRYIQREEHNDVATKALRFTAKLFGLEEATEQWLKASAAQKAATNSNPSTTPSHPSAAVSASPFANAPLTNPQNSAWASQDPWGDYSGQLPGQAPKSVEPLQPATEPSSAPAQNNLPPAPGPASVNRTPGWLGGLLRPNHPEPAPPSSTSPQLSPGPASPSSPKGWQRLTTRFGGLLKQLNQPAGPIAPLNSQASHLNTPPPVAPTNANLGLEQSQHQPNGAKSQGSALSKAATGNLTQANLNDPQIEAAWQKRVARGRARVGHSQSENVTFRSASTSSPVPVTHPVQPASETPTESADSTRIKIAEDSLTYESPYIETTAQFNGYERHPLEIVLDQLDRILLWIEEQGLRLWQWLTNTGEQ